MVDCCHYITTALICGKGSGEHDGEGLAGESDL